MISCRRARAFIVAGVRGRRGESKRVAVAEHVAECDACRAEEARWSVMAELRRYSPPSLGAAARERIVDRLRGAAQQSSSPAMSSSSSFSARPRFSAGVTAALSAAAMIALAGGALVWRHRAAPPASRVAVAAARAKPDVIAFAGAELRYGGDARVQLRPATREIAVDGGELEVTAAAPDAPLKVVAPRYRLIIGQAHVRIAGDMIRVLAGSVEVYSSDNKLVATVPGGSAWHAPSTAPAATVTPPTAPSTIVATARPPAPVPSARVSLERARAALVRGDGDEARRSSRRALALATSPVERAQAELLLADVLLVESDGDGAARAYLDVARAHPDLAAGETAAFAAAQILWERGRVAQAADALHEYVRRYPDGRFAREARERLAALPSQ